MSELSKNAKTLATILRRQFASKNGNFDEFDDFASLPFSGDELQSCCDELVQAGYVSIDYDDNENMYLYIYMSILDFK